jgi:sugar fermentation stimulation protein A
MKYPHALIEGHLLRRYKRFLADVQLPEGGTVTAHTANTGSMLGCCEPGSRVWLSRSNNTKRKYPYTWELVEVDNHKNTLVGINTMRANHLVKEAIETNKVDTLSQYTNIRTEVRYGCENSRIDLLLETDETSATKVKPCYIEVKNVTMAQGGVGYFPDAKSVRASKHLRELLAMVEQGARAMIFFCVPRDDVSQVRPAQTIDPAYAQTLREAMTGGVEALAYRADVNPGEIWLSKKIPVVLE